jgi:hypothetical protein
MHTQPFLDLLNQAASINSDLLKKNGIEVETGEWLNSIVLRLHKKSWANSLLTQPQTGPAIFFSIWLSDSPANQQQFFYNIHALKIRKLKSYNLKGRDFAAAFREEFKQFEDRWPNVSTQYGPLTLMQGLQLISIDKFVGDVTLLLRDFIGIANIIDLLLKRQTKDS